MNDDIKEVLPRPSLTSTEIAGSFLYHPYFPFIGATTDFLFISNTLGLCVGKLETISFSAERLRKGIPKSARIPITVALEVLNLQSAIVYWVNYSSSDFPDSQIVYQQVIQNEGFLFKNRRKVIRGYIVFLKSYFYTVYGIFFTENILEKVKMLLEE